MKKLSFCMALIFGLSLSVNSMAALTELSDDEMRDIDGFIIGGGLSEEIQSELIKKFAAGDKEAIALIAETNRMVNDARNGQITESNFLNYYFEHLRNLVNFGFSSDIIYRQANTILEAQRRAQEQAALDQFRRQLFQQFIGQLTNYANSVREGKPNHSILIDLNQLIGTIPQYR